MDINVKDINMRYYQPEFDDLPITILYDEEKHEANRNKIQNYISMIKTLIMKNIHTKTIYTMI